MVAGRAQLRIVEALHWLRSASVRFTGDPVRPGPVPGAVEGAEAVQERRRIQISFPRYEEPPWHLMQ